MISNPKKTANISITSGMEKITGGKLWLAPLAGFADSTFRKICKQNGADVAVTEMISAHGLVYENEKTESMLGFNEIERPLGIQIFGDEPKIIAQGIGKIKQFHPDFIDINMGCPMKKVVKTGSGSALLKNVEKLYQVVLAAKSAIAKEFPLTVKIRSGWDTSENIDQIVQAIETGGANAIIFHPRTKNEMFSGQSTWDLIAKVNQIVKIPVIGNGDINSPEDAKKMFEETGCNSIMIGRSAIGNPFLFNQIKEYLRTGDYTEPSPQQRISLLLSHFSEIKKTEGADRSTRIIRKYVSGYSKGLTGAKAFRQKCNFTKNETEFEKIVNDFRKEF